MQVVVDGKEKPFTSLGILIHEPVSRALEALAAQLPELLIVDIEATSPLTACCSLCTLLRVRTRNKAAFRAEIAANLLELCRASDDVCLSASFAIAAEDDERGAILEDALTFWTSLAAGVFAFAQVSNLSADALEHLGKVRDFAERVELVDSPARLCELLGEMAEESDWWLAWLESISPEK